MSVLEHFRRQFEYEFWANGEVLRALAALSEAPAQALTTFSHIIAANWVWLDRLEGRPQRLPVWADLSVTENGQHLQELQAGWQSYLGSLSDQTLWSRCGYINSKGERWESTVSDILSHVLLHSAYHRGQVALEMRRSGNAPAYTDFIHAARQGFLSKGTL
jgi:uncharacterized damage-inducible protein DinB